MFSTFVKSCSVQLAVKHQGPEGSPYSLNRGFAGLNRLSPRFVLRSNITDNDSAKMKTGHGVIQGYNGVAAVDGKHRVVVAAEAYGQGQEHGLLEPMLDRARENLNRDGKDDVLGGAKVLADSGYHSNRTLEHLKEQQIDAYIADNAFRSRAPRFQTASPLWTNLSNEVRKVIIKRV